MSRVVAKSGLLKILLLIGVFLLAFAVASLLGPAARQARRLARARAHADRIRDSIKSDPRFQKIRLGAFTGGGGMFAVFGVVNSEENLTDLQRRVADSQPPVEVMWLVKVVEPPEEKASSEQGAEGAAARHAP